MVCSNLGCVGIDKEIATVIVVHGLVSLTLTKINIQHGIHANQPIEITLCEN